MAKTQYSFSDDPKLLGAPQDFTVTVRNIKVSAGAGFLVALTGDILTMPGLPKVPAAEKIDVDEHGEDQRAVLSRYPSFHFIMIQALPWEVLFPGQCFLEDL